MRRTFALWIFVLAVAGAIGAQELVVSPSGASTPFDGGPVSTPIESPGIELTKALGSEVVTHTCAGWGLGAPVGAWSCSGTTITRTASGSDLAITNATVTALLTYELTYTITRTAGTITPAIGGTSGTARAASGTYTEYITAGATTAVTLTADASFAGTITAVSVKPVTSDVTTDSGPLVFGPAGSIRLVPASTYEILAFGSLRMSNNGVIYFSDGTAAAPSLALGSDADGSGTGFYRPTPNSLGFTGNGAVKWRWYNVSGSNWALAPWDSNVHDLGTTTALVRSGWVGTSTQGSSSKTLTESSATTFAKVTMTSGSSFSGVVIYEIKASDATDFQTLGGLLSVQAIDKAGTITCQVNEVASGAVPAVPVALTSAGTLTNTFACADAGSNVFNINATAVSSLTQTSLTIGHRLNSTDTMAYAPQ